MVTVASISIHRGTSLLYALDRRLWAPYQGC